MAERPRELRDFKGWVNLRLNFRLKDYVSRQYLYEPFLRLRRISGNLSAFFEGKWIALSANFRRKRCCPPSTVGVRKLE